MENKDEFLAEIANMLNKCKEPVLFFGRRGGGGGA
jgi:hypothetical protein